MKKKALTNALLILLTFTATVVSARAKILTVASEGGKFASVQLAIDAAHDGDTIEVHAGTYNGNLKLEKRLTLQGLGRPILRGSGEGSVLTILAHGCVIRGFTVEHSGADLTREDSGILLKSNENTVAENDLRDVLFGIYLYASSGNVISKNHIRGRSELESGERGAGLHLWNSKDNRIEDNVISDSRDGMYIQNCTDNQIRRNRVSNLRYGLHYMSSDRNIFEDNYFSNNVAGAAIMYSNRIEFRRNAFVHNRGFSSFGILFQECNDLVAENNFIIDNETGIFMEALRRTTFWHNVIAENDVAIQMFSNADENVFTENNFVGNLSPLWLIGKTSTTRWAENGRGNFWSNYDGYDLDGDGRGDVRHKLQNVFEYMEGNYPQLRLYLNSPAAQALATAEKSFPILRGSPIADPAPLMRAVPLKFSFPHQGQVRRGPSPLLVVSLLMAVVSAGVIWQGQRKKGKRGDFKPRLSV